MRVLPISSKSFIKEKCHNCRTNDGIDIKLDITNLTGSTTKLDKRRKKQRQKNLTTTSCQEIERSLLFF